MFNVSKIEYTIIEDGVCTVRADVEDIRLESLATYWQPAEYTNAMCITSFALEEDDDKFPYDDLEGNKMITYLESMKDPGWEIDETNDDFF